jgi:hypothetical protein
MSLDAFFKDAKQIHRLIVMFLYIIGGSISSYYLFAFKVDKYGLYYKDGDQLWLAIGIGILILGWFVKNWKKI